MKSGNDLPPSPPETPAGLSAAADEGPAQSPSPTAPPAEAELSDEQLETVVGGAGNGLAFSLFPKPDPAAKV